MQQVSTDRPFEVLKQAVVGRFTELVSGSETPLIVDYGRDEIWEVYLNAFADPEVRQYYNGNYDKSFIRSAGGIVTIAPDTMTLKTLWSDLPGEISEEQRVAVEALDAYVRSRPIKGMWFHDKRPHVGVVDSNLDKNRDIQWTHFFAPVPKKFRTTAALVRRAGSFRDDMAVLKRSLTELTMDSVETVLELIAQGNLYRGEEHKKSLQSFQVLQRAHVDIQAFASTPGADAGYLDRFYWAAAQRSAGPVARIRNTSIGTLLIDLSEGKDIERAVGAYENVVAPTNYKRPQALVTPKMVEKAKADITELGFESALHRRRLDSRDLTAADALFVYRPTKANKDVFDQLSDEAPAADAKKLSKVTEIPVDKFLQDVVPTAKGIRVLFERPHFNNLVGLTGPQEAEAPSLFNWDNSFGWSYAGQVADSIKERVKSRGGRVDGAELSGLGFSSTQRNHLFVEVEGKFKSIVKVLF